MAKSSRGRGDQAPQPPCCLVSAGPRTLQARRIAPPRRRRPQCPGTRGPGAFLAGAEVDAYIVGRSRSPSLRRRWRASGPWRKGSRGAATTLFMMSTWPLSKTAIETYRGSIEVAGSAVVLGTDRKRAGPERDPIVWTGPGYPAQVATLATLTKVNVGFYYHPTAESDFQGLVDGLSE
jgi:hypothetical protein